MGTALKVSISAVVGGIGSLLVATGAIHVWGTLFAGPPDFGGPVYRVIVPLTVIGALILSPLLFALCYRILSSKPKEK